MTRSAPNRLADFFDTYTRDLKAEDLQRLFTRDTREAYQFFTRGTDADAFKHLPWYTRAWLRVKHLFIAFTMRLSPARRVVYAASSSAYGGAMGSSLGQCEDLAMVAKSPYAAAKLASNS